MDIETQRVWDYAGDGYVHRLIQNKSDGKLVELPSSPSAAAEAGEGEMVPREKIENMGLEYAYLLTSQLDSQRLYYEEKTAKAADKASSATASAEKAAAEAAAALASLHSLEAEYAHLTEEVLPELEKGKARAEAKVTKYTELARKMEKEWREEKRVGEGLLERVKHLDKENEDRGKEVAELKEQVRDLMFFLQAREKMGDAEEEVVEGTITVGDAPREAGGKRRKGKGKR
jgi:BRCA1-associated protein